MFQTEDQTDDIFCIIWFWGVNLCIPFFVVLNETTLFEKQSYQ